MRNRRLFGPVLSLLLLCGALGAQSSSGPQVSCNRTLFANVVALDQPIMLNRLGSYIPGGMIYALARDVVASDSQTPCSGGSCKAGKVQLREGKRPRPIVLRMNVGDCLVVQFTNLVEPSLPPTTQGWASPPQDDLQLYDSESGLPVVGKLWGQSATRAIGFHVAGLDLASPPSTPSGSNCLPNLGSDADWVGQNCSSLAHPGQTLFYKYYAREDGNYLVYSNDDAQGAPLSGNAGQQQAGLFGSVNVEPENAEYYRSQVTHNDLLQATLVACGPARSTECVANHFSKGPLGNMKLTPASEAQSGPQRTIQSEELKGCSAAGTSLPLWMLTTLNSLEKSETHWTTPVVKCEGDRLYTIDGHPVINYQAQYLNAAGGQQKGTPILNMLQAISPTSQNGQAKQEIVHSDLTAVITGPEAGRFPNYQDSPLFNQNPALPDRREPFREFTIHYHVSNTVVQPFAAFSEGPLKDVLNAGADGFGINYGMGAIGPEVLANRLGVGPEADCVECKFEEFFLSSWAVGDPAMLVDNPSGAKPSPSKPSSYRPQATGANKVFAQGTHLPGSSSQAVIPQATMNSVVVPSAETIAAMAAPKPLRATVVYYPDDPSNVYHSYTREHVKFRINNVSIGQPHVHHQHAHQWLQSPNSDSSAYLDSQMIVPGSTYTLEMVYSGSGNRNQTVGDSIFHCHFYPHFAAGMWSLWRVHDVFEAGTLLDKDGKVVSGPNVWNRALPDGEIETGTPIPAIVPVPTLAMAPIPARVQVVDKGTRAIVEPETAANSTAPKYRNPGYPFFIPGVGGHRAPHPPLDFAWEESTPGVPVTDANGRKTLLDGGLPRHLIIGGDVVRELHTRWDFTKDNVVYQDKEHNKYLAGALTAFVLPEDGTAVERAAMAANAKRTDFGWQPDGKPGNFINNGLPPAHGGPYARPDVDDNGNSVTNTRRYKAAVIQTDVVLNKVGWHYPQQRFLTLWNDVAPTFTGARPPEPLFFRANTGDSIEYWHTNLVPGYYELDDFQVRTPTDIIGQHIHLVKFDVLASDGAANGFNYEDGTFSPDEVRDRIEAINHAKSLVGGGLHEGSSTPGGDYPQIEQCISSSLPLHPCIEKVSTVMLTPKPAPAVFGPAPPGQNFTGAQTTIQLWMADPLLNNRGHDRTLRTVFTHDHFGPSTHQNVGLYAGLLVEPSGSTWLDSQTGTPMGARPDGGPTSWQANIITKNKDESYREFALEFQDLQLAYTATSKSSPTTPSAPLFVEPMPDNNRFHENIDSLNSGKVPQDLCQAFCASGIVLSAGSKAGACQPSSNQCTQAKSAPCGADCWTIQDPKFPGFPLEVKAVQPPALPAGFQAFTPNMTPGWADPAHALAPPGADPYPSNTSAPYPLLVDTSPGVGTYSSNYRNEPVPLRVQPGTNSGNAADLSWAFASLSNRNIPQLNTQPEDCPTKPNCPISSSSNFKYPQVPLTAGMTGPDPYMPLLRAYENDRVQIRTLVGAHVTTHPFMLHGLNWLYEPQYGNSGYKSLQGMGLSEHFEMLFQVPSPVKPPNTQFSDYLYAPSSGVSGTQQGLWGLFRAYDGKVSKQPDLTPLPNNLAGTAQNPTIGTCPADATPRAYTVVARTAKQIGLTGGLVYNSRGQSSLVSPDALLYVNTDDLDPVTRNLKAGLRVEPLILRANAGECVQVTLINQLTAAAAAPDSQALAAPFGSANTLFRFAVTDAQVQMLDSSSSVPTPDFVVSQFKQNGIQLTNSMITVGTPAGSWTVTSGTNQYALNIAGDTITVTAPAFSFQALTPSITVGLHAAEVSYNVRMSDGANVGYNNTPSSATPLPSPDTAGPGGGAVQMSWYAGNITEKPDGKVQAIPIEFGSLPLIPSDPINHAGNGLIGALVIEPPGATWVLDQGTRASGTVSLANGDKFREFVLLLQNGILGASGTVGAGPNQVSINGSAGVNYRSEPNGYVPPQAGGFSILPRAPSPCAPTLPANTLLQSYVRALDECVVGSVEGCLAHNGSAKNACLRDQFRNPPQNPQYGFTLIPAATSAVASGIWTVNDGSASYTVTYVNGRLNFTKNGSNTVLASVYAAPALVEALDGVGEGSAGAVLHAAFPAISTTATASIQTPRSWIITNGVYTIDVAAPNIVNGQVNTNLQVTYTINNSPGTNGLLIDYANFLATPTNVNNAPQTPIFCAQAGQKVRFRLVQPGTDTDQMVEIHGHSWEQEPYQENGSRIGHNPNSQQMGTQVISPNDRLDLVLDSAGGAFAQPGDYLYHAFMSQQLGMWGVMRVSANQPESCPDMQSQH
jgi:hypothetical protein